MLFPQLLSLSADPEISWNWNYIRGQDNLRILIAHIWTLSPKEPVSSELRLKTIQNHSSLPGSLVVALTSHTWSTLINPKHARTLVGAHIEPIRSRANDTLTSSRVILCSAFCFSCVRLPTKLLLTTVAQPATRVF